MNIQLQAVNFSPKENLNTFLKNKLDKLDQLSDQIISADVYLKLDNESDKRNKHSEIILSVPGENMVVKKNCETFEECIDSSIDALRKMIIKRKEMSRP